MAQSSRPAAGEMGARLKRVREEMARAGVDALLVRGTDRYLNEYVPAAESLRIWVSGFTGSVGDALIARDRAYVFVDGRYYLQADRETEPALYEVVRVPFGTAVDDAMREKVVELARKAGKGFSLGVEQEKISVELLGKLRESIETAQGRVAVLEDNPVARAWGQVPTAEGRPLEAVAERAAGESSAAKLERVRQALEKAGRGGLLLTRLDEIAWIANLRGYEIDYSSTFRAVAFVGGRQAWLFVDPAKLSDAVRRALGPAWTLAPEEGWADVLAQAFASEAPKGPVVVDPAGSSEAARARLKRALGAGEIVLETSPVVELKARKNPRELAAMADSFRRADKVVTEATAWLNRQIGKGKPVNEREFADKVEELFLAAGARSLSFKVIAAAGENGAIIHYSHPDPKRRVKKGELMLLDTGAYFEPGYATDLTRTFLAGASARPTARQKLIYTLVLKASIRGLAARFPRGTTGVQLDAIVRAPIWEAGYDYLHGTGHGVGVLVHEGPPRLATRSYTPLEPGHVFSIEPGIYREGWGGVRIENLATVVEDPRAKGFLQVKPLTFAPVDRRLIDAHLLSDDEKRWLRRWQRQA